LDFFVEKVDEKTTPSKVSLPPKTGKLPPKVGKVDDIKSKLVTLIIMDGFGIHPDPLGNAVLAAKTPFLDRVWTMGKSTLLNASGIHVGLPEGEPGNSEVGHISIGAGQVVGQSLVRINEAIDNNSFGEIDEIKKAIEEVKKRKSNLHLIGIATESGVHGHLDHLFALMDVCKANDINPCIHIITDGRDNGRTDAYYYISKLVSKIKEIGIGKISSVSGRFYSMDRDKRWERTQKAYNAMIGLGQVKSVDVFGLLQNVYKTGENDEMLTPATLVDTTGNPIGAIKDNDVVLFTNFREDRARQLTTVFVVDKFDGFTRLNLPKNIYFVTMTGYSEDLPTHVIFPSKKVANTLSSIISKANLHQLHISETEKFMHITYFFNGGQEKPHALEDFFNVPSQRVADYSQTPQMSAYIIRDEVSYRLEKLEEEPYSFILVNLANPDMVGHTGNFEATVHACEVVDECVRDITKKTIEKGGVVVITADHGNCESMIDRISKREDNAHTNNPVPFIFISDKQQVDETKQYDFNKIGTGSHAKTNGMLADIAPTILEILEVQKGSEMSGVNLLKIH
jgi:2,3-bisphosphoglycerate-independent phosphoglycerate mutase